MGDFLISNKISYGTVSEAFHAGISKQLLIASISAIIFILSTSQLLQLLYVSTSTYICFSAPNPWVKMQHIASTLIDALSISFVANLIKASTIKKEGLRITINYFALVAMVRAEVGTFSYDQN